ncbi:MAG: LuxR C-terminal-related transcriptional regulator [Solirubrobacteraceae bacterium]
MTTINPEPVRLVLGEFEDIVSHGLQALLREDSRLLLVAADVEQPRLAATIAATRADVAILNAASLTTSVELHYLRATFPATRLVVLADQPTPTECRQLIDAGATACLAKSACVQELLEAIRLGFATGDAVAPATVPAPLTQCEVDVLELLRSGRSNAEIAATLHVGFETVRSHTSSIYRKLGVSSRRELRSGEVALAPAHHGAP